MATERRRPKRETLTDKVMNEVVIYGGFPVRYGTLFRHLDEVAKEIVKKNPSENAMGIRDAGLMGFCQRERMHPTELPDDVEPLTYEEFKEAIEIPAGSRVPEHILRKWETIYPDSERGSRFCTPKRPSKRKKTKRATAQAGVRGVR